MQDFQQYYKMLVYLKKTEEVQEFLDDFVKENGWLHYWYMQSNYNIHAKTPVFNLTNYPLEFKDDYINNERMRHDPVVIHTFNSMLPKFWSEMFNHNTLKNEFNSQLEWARQFGIDFGISCPLFMFGSLVGLLHFALEKNFIKKLTELNHFRLHINTFSLFAFQKLSMLSNNVEATVTLSARETECLMWSARGKTTWETAKILHLSEHTIREYVAHAKQKLRASSTTEAVVKAFLHQQLTSFNFVELQK